METEEQRLRRQIDALQRQADRLNRPRTTDEMNALSRAYMRADAVAQQFGEKALQALPGESVLAFRKRLAGNFQRHSRQFKDADLHLMDERTLAPVEDAIYQDAAAKANDPASYGPGVLKEIRFRDAAGRQCSRFVGDGHVWRQFFDSGAQIGTIRTPDQLRAMGRLHHQ